MINWKCPNCWTEYSLPTESQSQVRRIETVLAEKKDCKFCVRKDPNVPTTAEMDGLHTQEDMRNRHKVMVQCKACSKWTQQTQGKPYKPCDHCQQNSFDISSTKSIRTYNPVTDNKRKVKR